MLALAEELQNISLDCKRTGISRSHFYENQGRLREVRPGGLAPRRSGGPACQMKRRRRSSSGFSRWPNATQRADYVFVRQQYLRAVGLFNGAFDPPRRSTRFARSGAIARASSRMAAQHVMHLQKALDQM